MAGKAPKPDHSGHRARMRDRFFQTELKGFQPYEILEMLLYFTIPRSDTVPLARQLLAQYGSVRGVLNVPPDELMQMPGVSERTAFLFALLRQLYCKMLSEEMTGVLLDNYAKSKEFIRRLYAFDGSNEVLRCILMDNKLAVQSVQVLSTGGPDSVQTPVEDVVRMAKKSHCKNMMLAHNHPGNSCEPSPEDIASTRILVRRLREDGIALNDHIIIGEDGIVSLREHGTFFALEG